MYCSVVSVVPWKKALIFLSSLALFELLCLETYQAGLSWETVLTKRQAFRDAFYDYEII